MSSTTDNSKQVAAYNCQVSTTSFNGSVQMQGLYVGYKLNGGGNPINPSGFENQNMIAAINEDLPSFWVVDAEKSVDDIESDLSATQYEAIMWVFMTSKLTQDGVDLCEIDVPIETVTCRNVPSRKDRP